jgi:hypothetical protein
MTSSSGRWCTTAGSVHQVRGWLALVLGLLGVVVGAVWTLQGLGYLGDSVMTGETVWAIVGPVVGAIGLLLIALGLRTRSR